VAAELSQGYKYWFRNLDGRRVVVVIIKASFARRLCWHTDCKEAIFAHATADFWMRSSILVSICGFSSRRRTKQQWF
jgi:hypothetical protein